MGIVKPGSDAYTNTGEIEVKVSATSGKVEDVQVSYEGPHKGIVSLTPSGGVWRGTLPESLPSGSYTLRARAKSGGLERASPPVSFTLDREKPEVAILAPSSSILLSGSSLKVRAQARDALSGIKTVTLFANATRLNVNSVQRGDEYTFDLDVSSLPEGVLALRVVAEDKAGNSQEAQVDVVVDRTAPTVEWKIPPDGSQVSGVKTLEVEASDNVGVAKVEFFAGSTKLGEATTAPYTFSWNTTGYPDGPVTLRARAVDAAGNSAEATLTVTVANQDKEAPKVVWKAPADGSQVSRTVTLEVEASDNVGVAKVEFFAGSTKLGEATTAPYTFSWNTTGYPDGPVTLRARAVDAAGNSAEATLTVTVANAPKVSWVSPMPNQKLAGFVDLQAEVRALRAVSRVDFYFGPDENSLAKIPGSPSPSGNMYSLGWNLLHVSPGTYILKVEVEDVAGSLGTAVIPVEVASAFVITTPAEGDAVGPGAGREIVAVTVGVNGTLPPGVTISQVEVYINGQPVGTATQQTATDGSQVYVYTWDTSQAAPGHDPTKSGDRVITARVYYTGGDTFTNGVKVSYQP
ncbi:Ig-like domain-containing protein [Thermus scotoductus]|uniref:Ig-like domain-containing protein n=1 Tax=Thermus scotoductus TaxID=37636 RepID=UPI0020A5DFFD|nr:Ig-like domain-containing protein [Thermus scotoductus]